MFDRTVYINLDRSTDRRRRFESRVAEIADWPFGQVERVPGVDEDAPAWHRSGRGAWGCFRAHMSVYEHALQHGLRSVLIFEDDCVFCPDFASKARAFLRAVPRDWDMIFLGGNHYAVPSVVDDRVLRGRVVNAAHAYAIRGRAMVEVYRTLATFPHVLSDGEFHIDTLFGSLHEWQRVNAYCPWNWLCGQAAGPSERSSYVIPEDLYFQLNEPIIAHLRAELANKESVASD
jgi:hypothetical protein